MREQAKLAITFYDDNNENDVPVQPDLPKQAKPAIIFYDDDNENDVTVQPDLPKQAKPAVIFYGDSKENNDIPAQSPPNSIGDTKSSITSVQKPDATESLIKGRNNVVSSTQGEKGVYKPIPANPDKFIAVDKEEKKDYPIAVSIYQDILIRFNIRIFQNTFYIFIQATKVYTEYSDDNFDREIINANYKDIINCKERASTVYDEIKKLLRKEYDIYIKEETDISLHYWVFQNGLFDLQTRQLIQNDGSFFVRRVLQCNYNELAICPDFDDYIDSISGGDVSLCTLIWEAIGYLLSNDTNAKVFFLFYGVKDSGKSLLGSVIEDLIGKQWVSNISPSDLGRRFGTAPLKDKTLNSCLDLPDEPISSEAVRIIKAITGQDNIGIEEKFKQDVFERLTVKFLFASNHMIKSNDTAFTDRMIIIPFQYAIPKDRQIFGFKKSC